MILFSVSTYHHFSLQLESCHLFQVKQLENMKIVLSLKFKYFCLWKIADGSHHLFLFLNLTAEPKQYLERTIGFTINYTREDPNDPRELSEFPDIRLWFVRLDATYPWLPVLLDWRAGELARYAAMLVPHQVINVVSLSWFWSPGCSPEIFILPICCTAVQAYESSSCILEFTWYQYAH